MDRKAIERVYEGGNYTEGVNSADMEEERGCA